LFTNIHPSEKPSPTFINRVIPIPEALEPQFFSHRLLVFAGKKISPDSMGHRKKKDMIWYFYKLLVMVVY